jgi:hypothetical protein
LDKLILFFRAHLCSSGLLISWHRLLDDLILWWFGPSANALSISIAVHLTTLTGRTFNPNTDVKLTNAKDADVTLITAYISTGRWNTRAIHALFACTANDICTWIINAHPINTRLIT